MEAIGGQIGFSIIAKYLSFEFGFLSKIQKETIF